MTKLRHMNVVHALLGGLIMLAVAAACYAQDDPRVREITVGTCDGRHHDRSAATFPRRAIPARTARPHRGHAGSGMSE